jgi:DNA-binding beta-propeller fold protein YncE
LLIPALAFGCISGQVFAQEPPYWSFTYNSYGQSVPSPNGYRVFDVFDGHEFGAGHFSEPGDLYIDRSGRIYVLDSGNTRIVIIGRHHKVEKIIDSFITGAGDMIELTNPSGIHVDNSGYIYVADTDAGRILKLDENGLVSSIIGKPDTELFPPHIDYRPRRIIVDSGGNIYALTEGVFQGAIQYTPEGEFMGFFGSNYVKPTVQILADLFWKRFMTREQKDSMARYVPEELNGFDIDDEDFVYTVTKAAQSVATVQGVTTDMVRRLNPKGINTLRVLESKQRMMSGLYRDMYESTVTDVGVDDEGFINVLDLGRGRILQFDSEANFLFAFGGIGDLEGNFRLPVAVDTYDDKIYVLDRKKVNITVFELTEFGAMVHRAVNLYNAGYYDEAVEPWREILKRNFNYEYAYAGIAKSLYDQGKYREAMAYFREGQDRDGYSRALREYRIETTRVLLPIVMTSMVVLLVLLFGYRLTKRRTRRR